MNNFCPDQAMLRHYIQQKLSPEEEEKLELWLADKPEVVEDLRLDLAFVKCIQPDDLSSPEELVRRILLGDRHAETELVEKYQKTISFILHRKFWDKPFIDDVLQETFTAVIIAIREGKLREPKALPGFIRQTAFNIGYRYLRNDYKHQKDDDLDSTSELPDSNANLYDDIEKEDLLRFVRKAIEELPVKRDRKILIQFYYNGEGKADICKYLDISAEHFDRVIYRARERLKKLINNKLKKDDNSENNDEAKKK